MARIETERNGAVMTLINNDPATRNSLVEEFYLGANEALRQAEAQLSMASADRDSASAEYDSQNAQLERIRTLTGRGAGSASALQDHLMP